MAVISSPDDEPIPSIPTEGEGNKGEGSEQSTCTEGEGNKGEGNKGEGSEQSTCTEGEGNKGEGSEESTCTEGEGNKGEGSEESTYTEGEGNRGPAALGIRCGSIENKVNAIRPLKDVCLQLQANMCIASVLTLKKEFHQSDSASIKQLTTITCYGVILGPYPLLMLRSTFDFVNGALTYEELCCYSVLASHFMVIDSGIHFIFERLL